jgi:hypothetical protein
MIRWILDLSAIIPIENLKKGGCREYPYQIC